MFTPCFKWDREDELFTLINQLKEQMMADFSQLKAEIERTATVHQSVVALLQGIATQLEDARDDPVEIDQITMQLRATTDALAAAVEANTPPAPPVPPTQP